MYGNGVVIGMMTIITATAHRITHRAQIVVPGVFFAAVVGTTTTAAVGLQIAAGSIRSAGSTASGFDWFRRTDVSPYPQFRLGGI